MLELSFTLISGLHQNYATGASVNGRAFLKLPSKPDLMKKIGLSFVFEDNISDEIKLVGREWY